MSDYINREDAIEVINQGRLTKLIDADVAESGLKDLPAADVVPVAEIYDAGYKGKEVRFYIGGRLFAIRELAQ